VSSEGPSYRWLSEQLVLAVHQAQIAEHGGVAGVRDVGLLDSALKRPRNAAAYGATTVPELGALYALGIFKNHPFLDGNKRVATVLLEVFLEDNGYELCVPDEELFVTMLGVAAGDIADDAFKNWVAQAAAKDALAIPAP